MRHQHNLTMKGMKSVLMILSARGQGTMHLVEDVVDSICELLFEGTAPRLRSAMTTITVHPASIPPPLRRCPILNRIPAELRRAIFAELMPAKGTVIQPVCREGRKVKRDPKRKPKHNKTSDLLCLNSTLKDEMTSCIYAERIFAIHVHEGITTGGIEFLDTGRQPLQYKEEDGNGDDRFARFDDGKEFGIHELKKIEITIFPATETSRHAALNTYYMNYALARMLERGGKDGRIVSLIINFASQSEGHAQSQGNRRGIMRGEHWWWNPESDTPRATSINNVTDVELALRPFGILTHVHNVFINLPSKVRSHPGTVQFVEALKRSMQSKQLGGTLGPHDVLEFQAEAMRTELYDYICSLTWGGNGQKLADLNGEDMYDDTMPVSDFDDSPDSNKHGRSVSSQDLSSGVNKRLKKSKILEIMENNDEDEEDEDDDERISDDLPLQFALVDEFERKKNAKARTVRTITYTPLNYAAGSPHRRTRDERIDVMSQKSEAEFDRNNAGRILGTNPSSQSTQESKSILASLRLELQDRRRAELKLKVAGGGIGGPPVDSAMTGTFSNQRTSLLPPYSGRPQPSPSVPPNRDDGQLGEGQSDDNSLSGNGLLRSLNLERRQRPPGPLSSRQHRDQRLQRQRRPSSPVGPGRTLSNYNMQRDVSDVRRAFDASDLITDNEPIDLTGDDDDILSAPEPPRGQKPSRFAATLVNTETTRVSRMPRYIPTATPSTTNTGPPQHVQARQVNGEIHFTNGLATGGPPPTARSESLRQPTLKKWMDDEGGGSDDEA